MCIATIHFLLKNQWIFSREDMSLGHSWYIFNRYILFTFNTAIYKKYFIDQSNLQLNFYQNIDKNM